MNGRTGNRVGAAVSGGLARALVVMLLLAASSAAQAATKHFYWSVEGMPPTSINDLHLHFQIVSTPFSFGAVLIDDTGKFKSGAPSTPDSGGAFTINFDGETGVPAYGPADNIHVAFDFTSSEEVKLVLAEWTFDGVILGTAQDLPTTVTSTPVPIPSTAALLGLGLAQCLAGRWRSRPT